MSGRLAADNILSGQLPFNYAVRVHVSMLTQSETWFEEYCNNRKIDFDRIEESDEKTPDYTIRLDGQEIIVEVKEILPNAEEKKAMLEAKKNGTPFVTRILPGERIRKKIASASGQIKARTKGKSPSILLICDIRNGCGQVIPHLDQYHLRVAMEGLDQVVIGLPEDKNQSPTIIGRKSGPRKKMTPNANTSISAVAVLSTPPGEPIKIEVFHNKYAAHPILPEILRNNGMPQFSLSDNPGEPSDWIEM